MSILALAAGAALLVVLVPALFEEVRDQRLQAQAKRRLREERLWRMGFVPPLRDFNVPSTATFKVAEWEQVDVYHFATQTWHSSGWHCLRVVSVVDGEVVFTHPALVRVSGKTYLLSKQGGFRLAPYK